MRDERIKAKMDELVRKMNEHDKYIFKFEHDFKPYRENRVTPKEEGVYLTIRCGVGGIYTTANWWKDGDWVGRSLDGSETIAFSINRLEELENLQEEIKELERNIKDETN